MYWYLGAQLGLRLFQITCPEGISIQRTPSSPAPPAQRWTLHHPAHKRHEGNEFKPVHQVEFCIIRETWEGNKNEPEITRMQTIMVTPQVRYKQLRLLLSAGRFPALLYLGKHFDGNPGKDTEENTAEIPWIYPDQSEGYSYSLPKQLRITHRPGGGSHQCKNPAAVVSRLSFFS